jgi:hypothetical protein
MTPDSCHLSQQMDGSELVGTSTMDLSISGPQDPRFSEFSTPQYLDASPLLMGI